MDAYPRRRLRGWPFAIIAAASAAAAASVSLPATSVTPSGCTSIQDQPPMYSGIQYGAAIQGLFDNFLTDGGTAGCTDCHFAPPPTPSGHLNLSDGVAWAHLINIRSYDDPSLFYVVPNHPEQSLLFQKVNCDTPGEGGRMPSLGYPTGTTTLTPDQQALIYDWIAEGAPVGTTDGIFRNGFDIRGFSQ